jgi:serine phosphatase RsbU (regulator of sigma subunit)
MKLRLKLILAFFFLAVVPLASICIYSYWSSLTALRQAAERESQTLAEDMSSRLDSVSRDVNTRLGRLANLPFQPPQSAQRSQQLDTAIREQAQQFLSEMGEAAPFLESLQFTPADAPLPAIDSAQSAVSGTAASKGTQQSTLRASEGATRQNESLQRLNGIAAEISKLVKEREKLSSQQGQPPQQGRSPQGGQPPEGNQSAKAGPPPQTEQPRQGGQPPQGDQPPQGKQSPQGGQPNPGGPPSQGGQQPQAAWMGPNFLGRQFNTRIVENGQLVGTIQARVSSQQILRNVLVRTERKQGEIPFAIDADGNLHTPDPADVIKIETLPLPYPKNRETDAQSKKYEAQNWVIATRKDEPSGVIFGIARPIGSSLANLRLTAARNLGYGLLFVGLAIIGIIPLSRRMTRALSVLTNGVERLASGDRSARVQVQSKDEFGALAAAFNHMAEQLDETEKKLLEQERIRKEIELCREIQHAFLPKDTFRFDGIKTRGISIPAREVGGDFFNYFLLDGDRLALMIGDVSGKGLPAALLMANFQATVKAMLPLESDLGKLAVDLDKEIESSTPSELFLTLFIAILDLKTRTLRYVNAGHNPQLLLRSNGSFLRLESTGRPLGLIQGGGYEEVRLTLENGDCIFLYTDGLVDAENEGGQEFGMQNLERLLVEKAARGFEDSLEFVQNAVEHHRGAHEPDDDATMMLLHVS